MLPRPISFSGQRNFLPRRRPVNQRRSNGYHTSRNGALLLREPSNYTNNNDFLFIANRRPPRAYLRSTTAAWIITNNLTRRSFTNTTPYCALNRAKPGSSKLSRPKKSLLGAPKPPSKVQPKPVVEDHVDEASRVYTSFVQMALDPESQDEPEDVSSSSAAVSEDVRAKSSAGESAEESTKATTASSNKRIRKEKKVIQNAKPELVVAKKGEPVSSSLDKKASRSTTGRTHSVGQAHTASNVNTGACLALVPVSGPTGESSMDLDLKPLIDPWTLEFQRLLLKVDASKLQLNSFRRSIDSIRTRLRERHFENFKKSFAQNLSCAAERLLHKQAISVRSRRITSGLSSIAMSLRGLYKDTGDPLYAEYAETLVQDLKEYQLAAHDWRAFLLLRLEAHGSLKTSFDASWIYHQYELRSQITRSYFKSAGVTYASLMDLLDRRESDAIINSKTIYYTKKVLQSNQDVLGVSSEWRRILSQKAFHQFFLSKPKNDVHWEQLDFWAPFQLYLRSAYRTKAAVSIFFDNFDDNNLPSSSYSWEKLLPLSETHNRYITTMDETAILCTELFEINWIRLKLQRLTAGNSTLKEPRREAVLTPRKPLSASPGLFERWVKLASHFEPTSKVRPSKKPKTVSKKSSSSPRHTRSSKAERGSFTRANTKRQAEPKPASASYSALLSRPRPTSSEFPAYRSRAEGKAENIALRKPEETDPEKSRPNVSQRLRNRKPRASDSARKKRGRRSSKRSSRPQVSRSS